MSINLQLNHYCGKKRVMPWRQIPVKGFLLFLLMFAAFTASAQTNDIAGIVTDDKGQLMSGVNILVKGSTAGTVTDVNGRFTIKAAKEAVLVFSYTGYKTEEISVGDKLALTIALQPTSTSLSEVVVVGYGTVRKSDLTGAITSLRAEDFNKSAAASLTQLMSGKASGVRIVQNSNEPGGGVSVNIRGAGSVSAGTAPLYVVDGLPLDNTAAVNGSGQGYVSTNSVRSPLNSINPADIESIEILKDASATAIYGSRGANGVIMITTKKGKRGTTKVNYSGYYGIQNVYNKLDLLTAEEYKSVLNDIIDNGGGTAAERVGDIQNGGTDWQDAIYRKNAGIQNHNVSFAGGSEKSSFFVGLNYFDQDGVVVTSGLKRYGARVNFTNQVSDKFDFGVNVSTSYTRDNYAPEGTGFNENGGVIYAAINMDPTISIYNNEGVYQLSPFISTDNPLAIVYGKRAKSNSYRTFGTVYGNYKIIPGLTAKVNLGGDILSQRRDVYIDRTTIAGYAADGIASILNGAVSNYLAEGTLTYNKTIDEHRFTVLGGATTQRFIVNRNSQSASGFVSDGIETNSVGSGTQSTFGMGSSRSSNRLLSYLARINYSFMDKYLLTGSYRIDGSSRFGANNRFGYFPSFAGAWKISEEDFIKNSKTISNLKLKASWGRTGNQSIPDYQSFETYSEGPMGVFGGSLQTTQEPTRLPNPNLKWETTAQTDIGFEIGLFNNRLNASIDLYSKLTTDMLINKPISTTSGFSTQLSNIGSIRNRGIDFSVDAKIIEGKNFSWSAAGNVSTIKNKVLDIGGASEIIVGASGVLSDSPGLIRPGETLYSFYGYQIVGIWQKDDDFSATKDAVKPGDFKYWDTNGDSTVNADDRVILGNGFPKLAWGFSSNFRYKNFSLDFQIDAVHGVKMYNNNLADTYFPVSFRRNKLAEPYLNRWTEANPSNEYPSFITPLSQGQRIINSYTVEDASYVRLQNITLNYNFPAINKVFKSGSIYLTGQNLFTITKYTGMDPSINPNGNANFRVDFNAYPASRTFILGVNLDL